MSRSALGPRATFLLSACPRPVGRQECRRGDSSPRADRAAQQDDNGPAVHRYDLLGFDGGCHFGGFIFVALRRGGWVRRLHATQHNETQCNDATQRNPPTSLLNGGGAFSICRKLLVGQRMRRTAHESGQNVRCPTDRIGTLGGGGPGGTGSATGARPATMSRSNSRPRTK